MSDPKRPNSPGQNRGRGKKFFGFGNRNNRKPRVESTEETLDRQMSSENAKKAIEDFEKGTRSYGSGGKHGISPSFLIIVGLSAAAAVLAFVLIFLKKGA